jgi:hypothetical protein
MQLPPAKLVQDALLETVLPPFAAAAVVLAVVVGALGRRAAAAGAALAVVAGWAAGNYVRGVVPWQPDARRVEWLPWLAAAAAGAWLLTRVPRLRAGVGWAMWGAVVAVAVVKVLPAEYLKVPWWAVPAFVLATSAAGPGLAHLSRRDPGAGVPLLAALALFAAAAVLIHAGSAQLMDAATVAGAALLGVAAVALVAKVDAGGALPAAGVFLTGLLVAGFHETYGEVPASSFALPAVAPLAAAAVLIPPLSRLTGWRLRLVQFTLVLVPLAVAVGRAAAAEPLNFENL